MRLLWSTQMTRLHMTPRLYCWRLRLLALACAAVVGACGPRGTHFDIVDYRADGGTTAYFENFDECYYTIAPAGDFDCVARRRGAAEQDPDRQIIQIVHLRGIWLAQPGRTYAEDTMINTAVSYMIVDGSGGTSFEGGGFVSFRQNYRRTVATGDLELAKLAPVRRLGEGKQIFERAEVRGEFRAVRDRRRMLRILSEMQRLFGPMPRYEPPPNDADVL